MALDSVAEKEEKLTSERVCIEERVTQQHKITSKYICRQLQRFEGQCDESTRAAIEGQLRINTCRVVQYQFLSYNCFFKAIYVTKDERCHLRT